MLAERGGFEPPVGILSLQRFSKPPPSASRPPLRGQVKQAGAQYNIIGWSDFAPFRLNIRASFLAQADAIAM